MKTTAKQKAALVTKLNPLRRSRVPKAAPSLPVLSDQLQNFIGIIDDMPADLARNHDHYSRSLYWG